MIAQRPQLSLVFAPDRSLVWEHGGSVRYLVADVSATGTILTDRPRVAVNLALAIDVSGSMAGDKLEAARRTATAVADALGKDDRLTIVAFGDRAELLLDARLMDSRGRTAARKAIARLETQGCTNLFGGWDLAAGRIAEAMHADARASHRVLLLTDGLANVGFSDAPTLARFTGDAQRQGIITSTVGIGDDYDQALLAAMTEAGGGRVHDATSGEEIHEVVLGEILEGRTALVERGVLEVDLPVQVTKAEVVGPWVGGERNGKVNVLVGSLHQDQVRRIVLRVHCLGGPAGGPFDLCATFTAQLPDGSEELRVTAPPLVLRHADGATNGAQPRDVERSLVALAAWQGAVMRQAVQLNREGRGADAREFLRRERRFITRYAAGLPDTEALLHELELLEGQIHHDMDERLRKEVYLMQSKRGRGERDYRAREEVSMQDLLSQQPPAPKPQRRPRA